MSGSLHELLKISFCFVERYLNHVLSWYKSLVHTIRTTHDYATEGLPRFRARACAPVNASSPPIVIVTKADRYRIGYKNRYCNMCVFGFGSE